MDQRRRRNADFYPSGLANTSNPKDWEEDEEGIWTDKPVIPKSDPNESSKKGTESWPSQPQYRQGDTALIDFKGGLNYPTFAARAGEKLLPLKDDEDSKPDTTDFLDDKKQGKKMLPMIAVVHATAQAIR